MQTFELTFLVVQIVGSVLAVLRGIPGLGKETPEGRAKYSEWVFCLVWNTLFVFWGLEILPKL